MDALPVWPAYLFTTVLFLGIAVASLRLPPAHAFADAPDRRRWRDIRWWAVALIAVQLGLYGVFSG